MLRCLIYYQVNLVGYCCGHIVVVRSLSAPINDAYWISVQLPQSCCANQCSWHAEVSLYNLVADSMNTKQAKLELHWPVCCRIRLQMLLVCPVPLQLCCPLQALLFQFERTSCFFSLLVGWDRGLIGRPGIITEFARYYPCIAGTSDQERHEAYSKCIMHTCGYLLLHCAAQPCKPGTR